MSAPYGKAKFRNCADCGQPIVMINQQDGKPRRFASRFPYCLGCFGRRKDDPEFKSWLMRVLNASKKSRA